MRIEGSTAIVFGGASGLGEGAARRLADRGARVLIADLDEERARKLAAELGAEAAAVDVADADSVEAAVTTAATLGDGLRVSVNCAGIGTPAKLVRRGDPNALVDFAKVLEVNLLGTINVLRCAAAAMAAGDPLADGERGICVNTASIAAYDGQVGQVAYAASKAGVAGLTLPAARELAELGVRVVTVAPGLFDTPLLAGLLAPARESLADSIPFPPRLGAPSEYADLVEHLVVNRMLNGEVIRLDGSLRMAPR